MKIIIISSVLIAICLSVLIMQVYKRGNYDAHTNMMSTARFGQGIYTVTAPGFTAVYKLDTLTDTKNNVLLKGSAK